MITMRELVTDRTYRAFLETKPTLPAVARSKKKASSPPWVVYVQREVDGPWAKAKGDFWKYSEAFKAMRYWLGRGAHDVALNNKRYGFSPPMRRVRLRGKFVTGSDGVARQATKAVPWKLPAKMAMDQPEHHWCRYCRRPTVFKIYSSHKRLGRVDETPRCCICGASARIALEADDRLFRIH